MEVCIHVEDRSVSLKTHYIISSVCLLHFDPHLSADPNPAF